MRVGIDTRGRGKVISARETDFHGRRTRESDMLNTYEHASLQDVQYFVWREYFIMDRSRSTSIYN